MHFYSLKQTCHEKGTNKLPFSMDVTAIPRISTNYIDREKRSP